MTVSRPVKAEQPSTRAAFIEPRSGCLTNYGHRVLMALFNRTGGFDDSLADLLGPSLVGDVAALDIQDRIAALENTTADAIIISRLAETDEALDFLRRVLAGQAVFTGLNVDGFGDIVPYFGTLFYLDQTDAAVTTTTASTGSVSTPSVTVVPYGNAGTVTYQWLQISNNHTGWSISSDDLATTSFSNTLAPGDVLSDVFEVTAFDVTGAKTATARVQATLVNTL